MIAAREKVSAVALTLAVLFGAGRAASMPLANVIDLRAEGSSETTGSANGALFYQLTSPPTGTGDYDPFLRLQDAPIEEAFNTDYRFHGQAPLDAKSDPNFTRSMTLGSLLSIEVNSLEYYSFTLDLDEPNSDDKRDISLDEVKLYLAGAPDLSSLDS
ncbi:MAG: hypothetical protein HY568_03520, partial [Candidatus Latescibacteria bacterium]|nr:hypothetical protein [Candidatus Latescibacterota bacterium]